MASPWFTPGATTASWFGQPNSAAAASTSPQPSSEFSPALGQMFGQEPTPQQPASATPGIAPQAQPQPGSNDLGGGFQLSPYLMQGIRAAGMLGNAAGVPGSGGIAGGLGGLLNLGTGIATGNPAQAGQGALGAVSGVNSAYGALNNGVDAFSTLSPILSGVSAYLPVIGAALQGLTADMSPQAADSTAKQAMIASALSGITGGIAAPVLGVFMAINQALNPRGDMWPSIGKAATQMGEGALRGGSQANQMFSQVQQEGITDPSVLMQALTKGVNDLFPFYQTMEGPVAPISSANWIKKIQGGPQAGLADQYRQTQQGLMDNVFNTISKLHGMGVTPAQLGALPVNPRWSEGSLHGIDPGTTTATDAYRWNPQMQNLGGKALDQVTGGPLMSALWQINPTLYNTIGGNLTLNSQGPYDALGELLAGEKQQALMAEAQRQQAFTSGGG